MTEKTIALLVAAGESRRMGTDLPKPYLQMGPETLLRHTVRAFMNHPEIDGVRVVIRREHHMLYKQAIDGLTLFPCVIGGDARQESVRLGLESLAHRSPDYVLVHDIARPLVGPELISRVITALKKHQAVIPVLPVADTIKRVQNNMVGETIPRDHLYAVQTPQGFHFKALLDLHRQFAGRALTDDAALFEQAGIAVATVAGDVHNNKVTTQEDLQRMQSWLDTHSETRVGMGYDVHRLQPHAANTPIERQYIKICGINIPFDQYLEGHSDADVGLHAIVDAILGSIAAGDIGQHFPPTDRKWQGADSERFLLHAYELLTERQGELAHIDVTIIGEHPKISPHREQMKKHIETVLKLPPGRVSIKATTTEKLGFTGRGEGIAAEAVATVRLPRQA